MVSFNLERTFSGKNYSLLAEAKKKYIVELVGKSEKQKGKIDSYRIVSSGGWYALYVN